ncbi:MAG: hypothetical protein KDG50_01525 [Chromatiales bacterium]|nr:hypothetical protein [Chromatiales bacterium]
MRKDRPKRTDPLLSEIIRRAAAQGLAEGELARRAGIRPDAFSRKKTGTPPATVDELRRLGEVVGTRLGWLDGPAPEAVVDALAGTLFDD